MRTTRSHCVLPSLQNSGNTVWWLGMLSSLGTGHFFSDRTINIGPQKQKRPERTPFKCKDTTCSRRTEYRIFLKMFRITCRKIPELQRSVTALVKLRGITRLISKRQLWAKSTYFLVCNFAHWLVKLDACFSIKRYFNPSSGQCFEVRRYAAEQATTFSGALFFIPWHNSYWPKTPLNC